MRKMPTSLGIVMSPILLVAGLYLLHQAILDKSSNAIGMLVNGAVCFALSVITLVSAVRSILWHRHRLRHAMSNGRLATRTAGRKF